MKEEEKAQESTHIDCKDLMSGIKRREQQLQNNKLQHSSQKDGA
jgi:hypothetical protein